MAANHGRCAPSYITDDHHRRLLSGDHLHHGLLKLTPSICDIDKEIGNMNAAVVALLITLVIKMVTR